MRKQAVPLITAVSLCCAAMLFVDGIWQPGYWIKSGVKIILFLGVPLLCSGIWKGISLHTLFRPSRKGLLRAVCLGGAVYLLILSGYFLLRSAVDFSPVLDNLPEGVTKDTFLWVALYISFVNSLLEEFFFRCFVFDSLKDGPGELPAAAFSSLCFSLYHTAMMAGWFPPWLFLLALAGLAVGGGLFIALDRRTGTLYPSWFTHMFANFAINTVGFILL